MGPGGNFSSGDSSNFAFFRNANISGTWWFGVEDLPVGSGSDNDYNDMVVKVSTVVPLPPTLMLLGSGMLGLAVLGWRRRRRS